MIQNKNNLIKTIHKYLIIFPIILILLGIIIGIFLLNYEQKLIDEKGTNFIKNTEIKLQKEKIKILVNHSIRVVNLLKNDKNIFKKLQHLYIDKENYIFIYKLNYPLNKNILKHNNFAKMVVNVNRPDLIGKNVSLNKKDIKNKLFRKEMLKNILKRGETFVTYFYKNPTTNKITKKISYFKYDPTLNIIVASGTYLNTTNNIVKEYKKETNLIINELIKIFFIISGILLVIVLLIYKFILNLIIKEINNYNSIISKEAKKIKKQLYFDELTKLENRKLLIDKIKREIFDYLILVDIDNFRNINQFYNAEIGDEYLKKFALLLKEFKKTQFYPISIFRIGSDEFALGIRKANNFIIKQIVKNLHYFMKNQYIIIANNKFDIDITIVYAKSPNPLKKSLIALSIAKEKRVNICAYENIKDISKEKEFFEMRKMLKNAIEKNQITPYAQPIVNKNGEIIKYELLMRIVTPEKVIPPYFLEFAKKSKLYDELSQQMLIKSFEFIKQTDILCSINLDLEDIKNEDTLNIIRNSLNEINKPVVLEILESNSITDYTFFKEFLEEFRKKGVLFAIDDFGSGFSNYKEIISLKPDYVKIDGSLIKNILNDRDNLMLVYSIVSLSSLLEIKTTAEFVENEDIFKKLISLGVDEFQGYYFGKPIPTSEILKNN